MVLRCPEMEGRDGVEISGIEEERLSEVSILDFCRSSFKYPDTGAMLILSVSLQF